jgi:hypothetical protein
VETLPISSSLTSSIDGSEIVPEVDFNVASDFNLNFFDTIDGGQTVDSNVSSSVYKKSNKNQKLIPLSGKETESISLSTFSNFILDNPSNGKTIFTDFAL